MRAARVAVPGPAEAIAIVTVDDPAPGPGEALIRVERAGVNFIDVYHRTGLYPLPQPIALGQEGAGRVLAIGAGVTEVAVGDRVAWASASGSYATHVVASAARLVPLPDAVSAEVGAAAMLQGMTAHYLATSTFALEPGHTCVVHAAAGGVGLLLCQLARHVGARVIGVVSTDAKADAARAAGAAITCGADDLLLAVREATAGRGVDVVYDSVGASTFTTSLDALAPRGLLALFGQSSGPVPPLDLQVLARKGSLFITRPTLGHYVATRAELLGRAGEVLDLIARGELRITIDRVVPLDRVADAHRALESRATSGKVLLDCA
ncbi:MAG: quinone oxidoreductase [Deltaproteobacteria bacterium]|nr:quinone oxidoreductase [Deltaproteobacteria bacterium]